MAGLALGKKVALATMGTFLGGGTGKLYFTSEMIKSKQG